MRHARIVADEAGREARQPSHRAERQIAKPRNPALRPEAASIPVRSRPPPGRARPALASAAGARSPAQRNSPRASSCAGLRCRERATRRARRRGRGGRAPAWPPRYRPAARRYVRREFSVWRRAALAYLVEVAGGDVAGARGTKGVEADGAGRGGGFERAAKARVVGGEERIDASEGAKKLRRPGRSEVRSDFWAKSAATSRRSIE